MRLHICNGCGKEKMLDERVRHWHDCHPAKFTYMVKSDKILASQMVSAAQPRVQLTNGGRAKIKGGSNAAIRN